MTKMSDRNSIGLIAVIIASTVSLVTLARPLTIRSTNATTRQQRAATAAVPQQAQVATPVRSNQVNIGETGYLRRADGDGVLVFKLERHYLRRKA